jgi:Family of unknown function (DUF6069)
MTAVGRRQVPRRSAYRLLTVLAATAVAGLIWVLVVPVLGHPLRVDDLDIGFGAVLSLAFLAAVAGWGSLTLLERLTLRARGIWAAIAVLVLLMSFAPITSAGLDVLTRVALAALHLGVAVVVIPMLLHTSPLRRQSGDRSGH